MACRYCVATALDEVAFPVIKPGYAGRLSVTGEQGFALEDIGMKGDITAPTGKIVSIGKIQVISLSIAWFGHADACFDTEA